MLRLKQLLYECGVSQQAFADRTDFGSTVLWLSFTGRFPKKVERFKASVESAVSADPALSAWLQHRGLDMNAIWDEVEKTNNYAYPDWRRKSMSDAMQRSWSVPAIVPGDPLKTEKHKEAEMIEQRALKHFKLFRSPFLNDISDVRDIFLSEDHHFIKEMMLDTARYAGFTAVYGEVGSGKSVIRKAVVQELMSEDIKVVFPIIVDKSRITPGSLIDAIVMDISEEKTKRSLEAKTRQALQLLRNRATSGMKQVLIIEEAHLMNVKAMKALKQIYELEDGYSRLIGIILIGQPELKFLLDETRHPEMREVTRRVTCAEITGLDGDLDRYIVHKFKRINKKTEDIFSDDAFEAMAHRLQDKTGSGRIVSRGYPLTVNNLTAKAMNMAVDMGEEKVTAEVVMSL
ncbi:MAG: AAA family ATPase [Thermodesulfobacteriota bacterium]|nr:AAA family ATPase [Thermodesulfobacteriota bacterium]